MDTDFKKLLERTYINNNDQNTLKDIKDYFNLKISYSKIKQIITLMYGQELKQIKQDKTYYNISCTKNNFRIINNILFPEIYNNTYIKKNYSHLIDFFYLKESERTPNRTKRINKTLEQIANDIIYFCMCLGIPKNCISQILFYSSTKVNIKNIDLVYKSMKKEFKKYNNICSLCGSVYNLELHHIEPINKAPYLKYNLNNWVMLCTDCHKKQHNK